ncbi:class I glutamine amidotransferase-like protein [Pseudomassariella vexata]|uniref:Class I glutamine amidotransferase-like protein n=1 Tax=Pseudomassariella vexata TaxID=1141098 RepID=A0A1Y2DE85_9PEZI|nr:class I glutamine amidotransferase-like protein [Pseudomassariella vexata]ORY57591.1 class I glutamine amidotransferase-like protein [Pseudomassariella vexata]
MQDPTASFEEAGFLPNIYSLSQEFDYVQPRLTPIADVRRLPGTRQVLNVAVLECEQMPHKILNTHGNFTKIFEKWLASGLVPFNIGRPGKKLSINTSTCVVKDGQYPTDLAAVDALLITGSFDSVNDDFPWIHTLRRYISDVYTYQPHVKIFGGCFGHQLVAQALLTEHGALVKKSQYGWEIGVHEVEYNSRFTEYFGLDTTTTQYQFLHCDHVILISALPPNWICLGSTPLCETQGLFEPGRVLTYQGHPEFPRDILYQFVDRMGAAGVLSPEMYKISLNLIENEVDRVSAAVIAVAFLFEL